MHPSVTPNRVFIGDTLAFHLLFVTFGVGLPVIICLLELLALVTHKPRWRQVAHTWSKVLTILFIGGAISGTIVSLQFSLLWPKFTAFAAKIVGISFALEGVFFLIEALFLSVYMLSWKRFKPLWHWFCSLPIVVGALGSAFFITTVNGFMNTPTGFKLDAFGNPVDINVQKAVFNPAAATEIAHSILAYIFTTLLVMMAAYAFSLWRKKTTIDLKSMWLKIMTPLALITLLFGVAVGLAGDQSGKFLAKHEPAKLAAAEGLNATQVRAPLVIGGLVSGNRIKYGLRIPGLLSLLATNHINGQVEGLDKTPPADRPPLIIHYFFDAMVLIGMLTIAIPLLFLILRKFKSHLVSKRPVLLVLMAGGVLGLLGVEFGWMLTEFGRQPFVIHGIMRVNEAASVSKTAVALGGSLPGLYLILFALTIWSLKRTINLERDYK